MKSGNVDLTPKLERAISGYDVEDPTRRRGAGERPGLQPPPWPILTPCYNLASEFFIREKSAMPRPIHFEILSAEPEQTVAFYRDVFGWEFNAWDGPQAYWLVNTGANDQPGINGGVMGNHFEQRVINTIQVDSLDDAVAKIEAAGGEIAHGPREIPGIGQHAYCRDPQGAMFGVMQPAT